MAKFIALAILLLTLQYVETRAIWGVNDVIVGEPIPQAIAGDTLPLVSHRHPYMDNGLRDGYKEMFSCGTWCQMIIAAWAFPPYVFELFLHA